MQHIMFGNHLDTAFEEYHAEHPHVYELFKRFAFRLKNACLQKCGAKLIMERIRWEMAVERTKNEFKINNNYTSRYARKLMDECEEFEGFFDIRQLQR